MQRRTILFVILISLVWSRVKTTSLEETADEEEYEEYDEDGEEYDEDGEEYEDDGEDYETVEYYSDDEAEHDLDDEVEGACDGEGCEEYDDIDEEYDENDDDNLEYEENDDDNLEYDEESVGNDIHSKTVDENDTIDREYAENDDSRETDGEDLSSGVEQPDTDEEFDEIVETPESDDEVLGDDVIAEDHGRSDEDQEMLNEQFLTVTLVGKNKQLVEGEDEDEVEEELPTEDEQGAGDNKQVLEKDEQVLDKEEQVLDDEEHDVNQEKLDVDEEEQEVEEEEEIEEDEQEVDEDEQEVDEDEQEVDQDEQEVDEDEQEVQEDEVDAGKPEVDEDEQEVEEDEVEEDEQELEEDEDDVEKDEQEVEEDGHEVDDDALEADADEQDVDEDKEETEEDEQLIDDDEEIHEDEQKTSEDDQVLNNSKQVLDKSEQLFDEDKEIIDDDKLVLDDGERMLGKDQENTKTQKDETALKVKNKQTKSPKIKKDKDVKRLKTKKKAKKQPPTSTEGADVAKKLESTRTEETKNMRSTKAPEPPASKPSETPSIKIKKVNVPGTPEDTNDFDSQHDVEEIVSVEEQILKSGVKMEDTLLSLFDDEPIDGLDMLFGDIDGSTATKQANTATDQPTVGKEHSEELGIETDKEYKTAPNCEKDLPNCGFEGDNLMYFESDNGDNKHTEEKLSDSENENKYEKQFQKILELINDKRTNYESKIQVLEMQLVKLENQLLMENLSKTNSSASFSKLENHILKLENELLRLDHSFSQIRRENEKLAENQQTTSDELTLFKEENKQNEQKDYPVDFRSDITDVISTHQTKILELMNVIQDQSLYLRSVEEKSKALEGQNDGLQKQLTDQTLAMSELLKKLDLVSLEQVHQRQTLELALLAAQHAEQTANEQERIRRDEQEQRAKAKAAYLKSKAEQEEQVRQVAHNTGREKAGDKHSEPQKKTIRITKDGNKKKTPTKESATTDTRSKEPTSKSDRVQLQDKTVAQTSEPVKKTEKIKRTTTNDRQTKETHKKVTESKDSKSTSKTVKPVDNISGTVAVKAKGATGDSAAASATGDTPGASATKKPSSTDAPRSKPTSTSTTKIRSPTDKAPTSHKVATDSKSKSQTKMVRDSKGTQSKKGAPPKGTQSRASSNENVHTKPQSTTKPATGKQASKPAPSKASKQDESSKAVRSSSTKPSSKTQEKPTPNTKGTPGKKETSASGAVGSGTMETPQPKYMDASYTPAKDCFDHYMSGRKRDTAMKVRPKGAKSDIEVWCDMKNGGWTTIQRRQDGRTDFYRDWAAYKKGFGQGVFGEHWLGLENIHLISNQGHYSLRVDLADWERENVYAEYDLFLVEDEAEGYRLHISGYRGNAGDGFMNHNGIKFSTKDVDNDYAETDFSGSCAKRFTGAWWYNKCYKSNLNGKYYKGGDVDENAFDGVSWKPWKGPKYSMKKVEIKIRPKAANTKLVAS